MECVLSTCIALYAWETCAEFRNLPDPGTDWQPWLMIISNDPRLWKRVVRVMALTSPTPSAKLGNPVFLDVSLDVSDVDVSADVSP